MLIIDNNLATCLGRLDTVVKYLDSNSPPPTASSNPRLPRLAAPDTLLSA